MSLRMRQVLSRYAGRSHLLSNGGGSNTKKNNTSQRLMLLYVAAFFGHRRAIPSATRSCSKVEHSAPTAVGVRRYSTLLRGRHQHHKPTAWVGGLVVAVGQGTGAHAESRPLRVPPWHAACRSFTPSQARTEQRHVSVLSVSYKGGTDANDLHDCC